MSKTTNGKALLYMFCWYVTVLIFTAIFNPMFFLFFAQTCLLYMIGTIWMFSYINENVVLYYYTKVTNYFRNGILQ